MNAETTVQTITAAILAAGFAVALAQLFLLRRQIKSQHDWNRRAALYGFKFIEDREVLEAATRLQAVLGRPRSNAKVDLRKLMELSEQQRGEVTTDLRLVLNRLETLCVAMNHGVVDEASAYDAYLPSVSSWYRFYEPWIQDMRASVLPLPAYRFLEFYASKWTDMPVKERGKTA
jgi:hypothetical protein